MALKSAVVVGAGLAGLASALELARAGVRVSVLEAADRAGGRAQRWTQDGYRFDLGPTLIVMPQILRQTLGDDAFASLGLHRLEPGYTVRWPAGERFAMHSDLGLAVAEFERVERGSAARALAYLARVHEAATDARAKILERDHTAWSFARTLMSPGRMAPWVFGDLRTFTERTFRNRRIVEALTFQTLYLGLSPLRAPAMYALLPVEEMTGGVWFAPGGTGAIVDALVAACERAGVRFRFDARVEHVDVDSAGAVRVDYCGGRARADAAVIAADREPSRALFNGRMPRERSPHYGHSAHVLYLGIDASVPLDHHTVLLPGDPWRAYRQLDAGALPDEPLVYVCNPRASDPSFAPPGGAALLVLTPVPNRAHRAHFDEAALRSRVLDVVERYTGPIRDRIVVERTRGPREFESELGLMHGAAFGPGHGLRQMGPFRPPIAHPLFRNVVFAGSGTRPGSGVPMVLLSAKLAVERLLR